MEAIRDCGPKLKSFFYYECKPSDPSLIRGCVVVLHGAEGYGGRYEPFGNELVKNGYAMFAIDHIGHGKTAMDDKNEFGKWKKKDFYYSAYNAYYLVDKIKKMYPGKPVYVLGDDYGGSMAQYMMGKFENIFDGIIVSSCGMSTFRDKLMFLRCLVHKILFFDETKSKGTFKKRNRFLNMHFRPTRTKYDWLNSDPNEVDRFIEDPLAGYVCDVGYYYYQYQYIVLTPRFVRLRKVSRDFPILLLGGRDDYITHRGKQILKLQNYYRGKGFHNVETILYEKSRHDVLLERNKGEVARDIAEWINKHSRVEEPFVASNKKNEIIEVKTYTIKEDSRVVSSEGVNEITFAEEEPEDDLRLSTKLKKD